MTISDDQAVELLAEMLRIPSRCGEEDRLADLLLATMADAGFETCRDEVGNAIGSIGPVRVGPAASSLVILGHMDTVPGSIPVELRDGALYGRGAVDAKGPLATALVAAARAAENTARRITVIGAVQEEGPSLGARHLVAGRLANGPEGGHNVPQQTGRAAPDYLIIAEPSGWDAVVLGYKGSQRFTVSISQPCNHTASPEPTASERAVGFWNDLVAWCAGRASSGNSFDSLTPTLISMSSGSDGLHDTATLHIGLRLPPGLTPEAVQADVRALLPDVPSRRGVTQGVPGTPWVTPGPKPVFDFSQGEPAVRGEKNTPLVAAFLRSIRSEGGTPRIKVKTGTSDMNVVGPVWRCPMVAYGPGNSRLDHTPNEHIEIDEYLRGIRVLTQVLKEL